MRPRSLHLSLAVAVSAVTLAACGGASSNEPAATSSDPAAGGTAPLDVTVGFYPYEFVAQRVGGDDVQVTNLTSPGAEPHDLELTPQQVAALSETDLVIYSRGFQPAVDEAVEQQAADRALDVLTAVQLIEGEHSDHEDEGGHEDEEEHAGEELEGDPHVWLDPTRLATIAGAVADSLGELDPDRAVVFEQRALELSAELKELDGEMREGLSSCERQEIVTSHDAFGYLAAAYGLEQVSLAGLSPEDEASPKRLAEVATYAKEKGVTTIFFEELVSPKVAQSLAREVDAEAKVLSPLEGPPESGDYLSAMRTNLESLRTALGCT
jgi:zinc transport system substrate-binding protein